MFDKDNNIGHDTRLVRHLIRREQLAPADHEKYLAGLPDDAEHGVETETRFARLWNTEPEPQG